MQKNIQLEGLPQESVPQGSIRVGWIGLGVMGVPMCQHLLIAGYPMAVFTRSKDKASGVLKNEASWCEILAAGAG